MLWVWVSAMANDLVSKLPHFIGMGWDGMGWVGYAGKRVWALWIVCVWCYIWGWNGGRVPWSVPVLPAE
jgi:hypothetical protein